MARRRKRATSIFDMWRVGAEMGTLAIEAQAVVTMRVLGMAGAWPVKSTENKLMSDEKPPEFAKAAVAATKMAMSGGRPDQILSAAMKPLTTKARANRKRLSKLVTR